MAMPAADRERAHRWTAREVRQLIRESPLATPRYELVEGELLVTPSPNGPHQRAVGLLMHALEEYLQHSPVGAAYPSPFDVELEPNTIVQPDVFVVPPQEARRLLTEMPARELLVACEVLSASSGRIDRVTKRFLYMRHVPAYWIVDLDARIVERWRPNEHRPEMVVELLEWNPRGATDSFRLDLPRYFARVFGETDESPAEKDAEASGDA